jgi:hypothetical protein
MKEEFKIKDPNISLSRAMNIFFPMLRRYGLKVVFLKALHFLKVKITGVRITTLRATNNFGNIQQIILDYYQHIRPMRWKRVERDTYRFNLVLDTIENEYVFGGVATAIITGTLFALTRKMSLRIITRYSSENPEAYFKFLDIMAIDHPKDIEFFSDALHKGAQQDMLEVSDKDVFMASSWWTSYVVSLVSIRKNFFHIIQELETVFYPYGDHTYWCERALQNPRSRYVVNSKVLFDFYQKYDLDHIKKNSVYFEPAFPKRLYMPSDDTFKPKTKYRLLFYARPHIDRNMYYTGIQVLKRLL